MKIYRPEGRCNISGERVRAARERAGISQERLAYKIQITGLDITQRSQSGRAAFLLSPLLTLYNKCCIVKTHETKGEALTWKRSPPGNA